MTKTAILIGGPKDTELREVRDNETFLEYIKPEPLEGWQISKANNLSDYLPPPIRFGYFVADMGISPDLTKVRIFLSEEIYKDARTKAAERELHAQYLRSNEKRKRNEILDGLKEQVSLLENQNATLSTERFWWRIVALSLGAGIVIGIILTLYLIGL